MKCKYAIVAFLMAFILMIQVYSAEEVTVNKAARVLNIVDIDLNCKEIKLEAAIANDKIRTVEDFSAFVKRKGAIAAINANFFAAYSDFSPVGTIICNGDYIWGANYGTSVYISDENRLVFRSADYYGKARLYINFVRDQDNIWHLNRTDLSKEAILFTNRIEEPIKIQQGVCIFLKDGFISEVKYAPFDLVNNEEV